MAIKKETHGAKKEAPAKEIKRIVYVGPNLANELINIREFMVLKELPKNMELLKKRYKDFDKLFVRLEDYPKVREKLKRPAGKYQNFRKKVLEGR